MQMSLEEVAAALGSTVGQGSQVAQGFSIDSRTLQRGELFFAIRGPRMDGHAFVAQAMERGAVGVVIETTAVDSIPKVVRPIAIPVPDTTSALQKLGRTARRKWGRKLVAITGSAGKTTTKEMTAALFSQRFSVLKSEGNLNNEYGLPLTLLRLGPTYDIAVVELAMSAAGEIAALSRIAEPQVGVVTNVAPVHLEFFDSVDAIASAKRELIDNLPADGTAVLNNDDARVRRFGAGFGGRVVTFGFEGGADFRAFNVLPTGTRSVSFKLESQVGSPDFNLNLPGRHNVRNALAAIATASLFDVPLSAIQVGLAGFQTLHQRSEVLTFPGGITVLNDSYNSNPLAMEMMLDTLAAWPGEGRRIVVAGEMLELGKTSPDLHREVGRKCVKSGADWVLAVQGEARSIVDGAIGSGLPAERGRFFARAEEAGAFCSSLKRSGDVILVKGSRGVHLEKVIGLLKAGCEAEMANGGAKLKG